MDSQKRSLYDYGTVGEDVVRETRTFQLTQSVYPPGQPLDTDNEFWMDGAVEIGTKLKVKKHGEFVYIRKDNGEIKGVALKPSRFALQAKKLEDLVTAIVKVSRVIKTVDTPNGQIQKIDKMGIEPLDSKEFWAHKRVIKHGQFRMRPYMTKNGLRWRLWLELEEPHFLESGDLWYGPRATIECEEATLLANALDEFSD